MSGSGPPRHRFRADLAESYVPDPDFAKIAVLVTPTDPTHVIELRAPFGPQRMRGAFYAVAEGEGSYGAAREEFEAHHQRVGPSRWIKRGRVEAYRALSRCIVHTVLSNGMDETTVEADQGDWIVRQPDGELTVLDAASFAERYRPAPTSD